MSTANKLTYLNTTKQKIKDGINALGGELTNESTFRSYANVLNDLYEDLPKVTNEETDEDITLNNTRKGKMVLDLKGNTSQASDPTPDSPVDVNVVSGDNTIEICGKNLFDKSKATQSKGVSTSNGSLYNDTNSFATDYIEIKPNLDYVANKYSSSSNRIYGYCYDNNKTPLENIVTNVNINTFKVTNTNAKYIRLTGLLADIDTYQLEKGSTSSTYKAYQGQNYPINLPVENLLPNNVTSQTINAIEFTKNNDKSVYAYGTASARTDLYFVGDGSNYGDLGLMAGTYTLSGCASNGASTTYMLLCVVQHSDTTTTTYADYGDGRTIQVQTGDKFRIFIRVANGILIDGTFYPQLEKGSKANSYTPYGTTPIEVGGTGENEDEFFKNTTDSEYYDSTLELDKWYLKKRIGKVVLDGSESWNGGSSATTSTSYTYLYSNAYDSLILGSYYNAYCNNFTNLGSDMSAGTSVNTDTISIGYTGNYKIRLMILTSRLGTQSVAGFKTWLSTHNTIVYYVLATPENILLNDTLQETLDSFYSYTGQTNISQTNNDMPFVIKASALKDFTTLE